MHNKRQRKRFNKTNLIFIEKGNERLFTDNFRMLYVYR